MPFSEKLFNEWEEAALRGSDQDFEDLSNFMKMFDARVAMTDVQMMRTLMLLLHERACVQHALAEILMGESYQKHALMKLFDGYGEDFGYFLYQYEPLPKEDDDDPRIQQVLSNFPTYHLAPGIYPRLIFQRGELMRCVTRINS